MVHYGRKSSRFWATARYRCLLPLLFLAALAGAAPARAQVEAINGNIRGRVVDPNGAAVPGATVAAKNDATGYTRSVETGPDGYYVLPSLPLGSYTVTVTKQGFSTVAHPGVV